MEDFSEEALVARLEDHAKDFDRLLEFVSADVYFPQEITEEDWANRFTKNKKNDAPKMAIKQATKKAKRARLNPANYKTVPELQQEALEEKLEEEEEEQKGVKRKRTDSDSELTPEPEPQNPLEVLGLVDARPVAPKPSRADLKELRDRLQERISQLRAKREAKESEEGAPPKKKRKKDKKDKKDKDKKKKKTSSTPNDAKQQPNGEENGKPTKRKRSESNSDAPQKDNQAHTEVAEESEQKSKKKPKTEANIKADVRYGVLEFNKGTPLPESLAKKKKGLSKKQLLHKLEKEKAKESKNGDKAVLEKKAWDKLMLKAKGEKVKDNVALVKKALKIEEKQKKKSKKEWKKREYEQKKVQEIKQKKRSANIAEYLAKKKERRISKKTGTKQKRPGFEGKKKKFLNK